MIGLIPHPNSAEDSDTPHDLNSAPCLQRRQRRHHPPSARYDTLQFPTRKPRSHHLPGLLDHRIEHDHNLTTGYDTALHQRQQHDSSVVEHARSALEWLTDKLRLLI